MAINEGTNCAVAACLPAAGMSVEKGKLLDGTNYWQHTFARQVSRRGVLRSLAYGGAGLTAAALLGCGSKPKPATSGGAATANQPKLGGEFHQPATADIYDLDVTYEGQTGPNGAATLAVESLLGFKYGPGVDPYTTDLVPRLAEKWETPDATNFTFHLRKGVNFAAVPPVPARELTSADWKFSLEYESRPNANQQFAKMPQAFYNWLLFGIDRVDAPDPYTVVVRFKEPYAPFLNYAAGNRLQALPHEIFDQYGNYQNHISGSGPFQLDETASQKGTRWVFKKNPGYWDAGKPYFDQITKLTITDNQTAFSAFQVGQLDTLLGGQALSTKDVQVVQAANPTAVVQSNVALNPYHMYLNMKRPPTDNVQVRRALSLALDRNEFIQTFTNGQGLWAVPGAFPDTFSQDEIKKMTYLKYDPQQAKQLLSAAGFANGIDLEFLFNKAYGATQQAIAELVQAQWAKAGVRMKLTVMADYNEYLKRTREGSGEDYQVTIRGKSLETDIDSYLYAIYDPNGGVEGGVAAFDPTLTPLVEGQRKEPDAAKRHELEREACAYIADQCWHLAVFRDVSYTVSHPNVKGLQIIWSAASSDWAKNTWVER